MMKEGCVMNVLVYSGRPQSCHINKRRLCYERSLREDEVQSRKVMTALDPMKVSYASVFPRARPD